MNLHHLQQFLAIAEKGSVRAAADSLGLSQPAISKSLRVLETELGVKLIERGARGSTLTAFGRVLYDRARLIGNELEQVTGELRELAGHTHGSVGLGSSATLAIVFLPQVVRALRARFPFAELHVVGGLPSVLLHRLMDGSLDIVVGPRPVQPIPRQIESIKLMETPSTIAVRQGHRLRRASSLRDFADAQWVLNSSASHTESTLHAAFSALDLPRPRIAVRADSFNAAYALIARTDLVGLMPTYLLQDKLVHNVLVLVKVPEITEVDSVEMLYRGDRPMPALAKELVSLLQAAASRLNARPDRP
ncbi:MAG: LysR family transcriptional regulator [Rhodospirillaceae bacterium]|nr:LysR family transcriptional regulator [Rhodospirillaceae bacterium]